MPRPEGTKPPASAGTVGLLWVIWLVGLAALTYFVQSDDSALPRLLEAAVLVLAAACVVMALVGSRRGAVRWPLWLGAGVVGVTICLAFWDLAAGSRSGALIFEFLVAVLGLLWIGEHLKHRKV